MMYFIMPERHTYIAGKSPMLRYIKSKKLVKLTPQQKAAQKRLTPCKKCGMFKGVDCHGTSSSEIRTLEAAIKYIEENWGANCKEESKEWYKESGCQSCFAKRVIKFLQKNIKFAKEEL